MKQYTDNFIHQMFNALSWEEEMKSFIRNIDCSDGVIWHRKREYNKIHQELAPLGYYVKKRAKPGCSITFKLNNLEGKADGWIYEDEKIIENIQIAIGFYGKKEADIDDDIMNGKDITTGGWVRDRLEDLYNRIETIIENKDKKKYENIDTLIVGSNNWFAKRVSTAEYQEIKNELNNYIKAKIFISSFKTIAIVDVDYVGNTGVLTFPTNHST